MPKAGHCRKAIILCQVIVQGLSCWLFQFAGSVACCDFFMPHGVHTCRVLFIYSTIIELIDFVILKENKSPSLSSGPWGEVKEKMEV